MKMHILTDNRAARRGILAEHGMSAYIECEATNILFDTGQSDVYCTNAQNMGVDLLGEVPYVTSFERANPLLFTGDEPDKSPDTMKDEQMLVIDGKKGLVIFLGCSHPGVINCLQHAVSMFPGRSVHTLVAGMHLEKADSKRVHTTIESLLGLGIERVVPLHCTGVMAIAQIKRLLGDRRLALCAGDSLES